MRIDHEQPMLVVDHAKSFENGIRFYSKRHKGYICISTVDDCNIIKTEWITTKEWRKKEKNKQGKIPDIIKTGLCIYPFTLSCLMVTEWLMSIDPMLAIRFMFIGYAVIILGLLILSSTIKRKKNVFKFHSAEHMVLNGYRDLGRVPSLEEISKFSRYSNSCGTNMITEIILILLMIFVCTYIPNPLYMEVGMLMSANVIIFLGEKGYLNFLQFFTTAEPSTKELMAAIEGLTKWVEFEKQFEKQEEKHEIRNFLKGFFKKEP